MIRTAAEELVAALHDATGSEVPVLVATEKGPAPGDAWLEVSGPEGPETYRIDTVGGVLRVRGNVPRAVLNGVWALNEILYEKGGIPDDLAIEGTFRLPFRIFHQTFKGIPGQRAHMRYISALGASHCLLWHDWHAFKKMRNVARGSVFPKAADPAKVAANVAVLRAAVEHALDYGLEPAAWFTEIACQDGPWTPEEERARFLASFPEEVLSDSGTYQGKVLCFSHPLVREHYREMIRNFLADFPEIAVLFLFSLDSGGEYCDPAACPRCAGMSKIDQRDRFVRFVAEEAERARPGIRVLTTTWSFEAGGEGIPANSIEELCRRQATLPDNAGAFAAAEVDGWQCERQRNALLEGMRDACRSAGQILVGYDDLHIGDDTLLLFAGGSTRDIQDYPLGVGAKLRRWAEIGADGVFDHWGARDEDVPCNSIACRAFLLDPFADAEAVCARIARLQFGAAGGKVFEAWRALEEAHAILSDACVFQPAQWPQWFDGSGLADAAGIEAALRMRPNIPKPGVKPDGRILYNDPATTHRVIAEAYAAAAPHLRAAVAEMRGAFALADDGPLFWRWMWNGGAPSPDRKEHIERQAWYLESVERATAATGTYHAVLARWKELAAKDRDAALRGYPGNCRTEVARAGEAFEAMSEFLHRVHTRFGPSQGLQANIEKYEGLRAMARDLLGT